MFSKSISDHTATPPSQKREWPVLGILGSLHPLLRSSTWGDSHQVYQVCVCVCVNV